jgi:hypothetical protein
LVISLAVVWSTSAPARTAADLDHAMNRCIGVAQDLDRTFDAFFDGRRINWAYSDDASLFAFRKYMTQTGFADFVQTAD